MEYKTRGYTKNKEIIKGIEYIKFRAIQQPKSKRIIINMFWPQNFNYKKYILTKKHIYDII